MIPFERQEKILDVLKGNNLIKIDELIKYLPGVSVSTLRRDIKELEKLGKVESIYGGAVRYLSNTDEMPISKKVLINQDKKEMIATLAADQVIDGESIYIDSGSTATLLLERLMKRNITIYTTNVGIFGEQLSELKAKIIIIGGEYNPVTSSLIGPVTESVLQDFFFDKAFLGVNGVDLKNGVTTPSLAEALKKRLVKEHSKKVYLLCDSSKFGLTANARAFPLDGNIIISDQNNKNLSEHVKLIFP